MRSKTVRTARLSIFLVLILLSQCKCESPRDSLASSIERALTTDNTTSYCEDFYAFTCENWFAGHPREWDSLAQVVTYKLTTKLKSALNATAPDAPEWQNKAVFFYQACEAGGSPSTDEEVNETLFQLKNYAGWPLGNATWAGNALTKTYGSVVGDLLRYKGVGYLFNARIRNSIVVLDPAPLGYSEVKSITKYPELILCIAEKLGVDTDSVQAKKDAFAIVKNELHTVDVLSKGGEQRSTIGELETKYPTLFSGYFKALFGSQEDLAPNVVVQVNLSEESLGKIEEQFKTLEEREYTMAATWELVRQRLKDQCPTGTADRQTAGDSLSCTDELLRQLPSMSNRLLIDALFNTSQVNQLESDFSTIVSYVRQAFQEKIGKVRFISPEDPTSRLFFNEKLINFRANLGLPKDLLSDDDLNEYYKNLDLLFDDNWWFAEFKTKIFHLQKDFNSFINPPSSGYFDLDSLPIESFGAYDYGLNAVTLGIGAASEPYYNPEYPGVAKFAGLGFHLARGVASAFDKEGIYYDWQGKYNPTVTNATISGTEDMYKCLAKEYNGYCFGSSKSCVDGASTASQNFADILGLDVAFSAYNLWLAEEGKGSNERLTGELATYGPEQLFFIIFAHGQCSKFTETGKQVAVDAKITPGPFRVKGTFENVAAFSGEFYCGTGNQCNAWSSAGSLKSLPLMTIIFVVFAIIKAI